MTCVVIGSGPAGVAAAQALSDAGRAVTLIDAGDTIEPGRMDVFDALSRHAPDAWPPGLAASARGAFPVTAKRVPLKPAYGSLFPYALDDHDLPLSRDRCDSLPSLAYGGLSNAWGASMLPVRTRDIPDWPLTVAQLAPHYRAVLRFVPIAAEDDELAAILPLYTDSPDALVRNRQANALLAHMRRHAKTLAARGFAFGSSRLAVAGGSNHSDRCRHSGLCLYGCPYRSIYNATHTLAKLTRTAKVTHRSGLYVDRLAVTEDAVTIHVHERGRPRATSQLVASRVFVACGPLSSTRLMLDSLGQHTRRLLDSQYVVIPMLSIRAAKVSVATQGLTLAQIFLELDDRRVSRYSTHLQLYGYNDLMLSLFTAKLHMREDVVERLLQPLLGRMVLAQAYLHSADSPGITLTTRDGRTQLVGERRGSTEAAINTLQRRLAAAARPLGLLPLIGLAQIGWPGKGNHVGGSFPMRRNPGALETDLLGRLPGWDRVHLVDGTVLPSIPATTITLTVMANAHRIACAAAALAS
jgi:choline dehydrogenase-like flavoprotein